MGILSRGRVLAAFALSLVVGGVWSTSGCGGPPGPANIMQKDNPLGPSFWIIPVPSDDESLLGRTFAAPPDPSKTLEE